MKTILVDNEMKAMNIFEAYAKDMPGVELMGKFTDGMDAMIFAKENPIDLAVMDVDTKGMDGISLGRLLKMIYPDIVLIYITCYENYALDAFQLHAAGYILKPYTREQLYYEIETAKLLSRRSKKGIFIKTFGHFDVFVDGCPIMFRSAKAKELLALLVDRQGGTVSTDQIICALWENRPNDEATQNLCSKICRTLRNELKEYGAEKILISNRGVKRVDTEKFSCDLYDLLEDDETAKKKFVGDYMLDYSWAEERLGLLHKYLTD